jgi:hypothetical protein
MSGVLIVHALYAASSPLIARVANANIWDEEVPQGKALPAISLLTISGVDRKRLAAGSSRRMMERIQATGLFNDAEERLEIMPLMMKPCSEVQVATITGLTGLTGITVRMAGRGPDFTDEAERRIGSWDFMVSWNEAT